MEHDRNLKFTIIFKHVQLLQNLHIFMSKFLLTAVPCSYKKITAMHKVQCSPVVSVQSVLLKYLSKKYKLDSELNWADQSASTRTRHVYEYV